MKTETPTDIGGAVALADWFGYWPSFHDAEVIRIVLDRNDTSVLVLHTFATSDELTSSGHYLTHKHTLVSVHFSDVLAVELDGFNHQNVLSCLFFKRRSDTGWDITLGGCYGVEGRIAARDVRISFEEGLPSGTTYSAHDELSTEWGACSKQRSLLRSATSLPERDVRQRQFGGDPRECGPQIAVWVC